MIRKILFVLMLVVVLSTPTLAGNISTPGVVEPPSFFEWVWGVITGDDDPGPIGLTDDGVITGD